MRLIKHLGLIHGKRLVFQPGLPSLQRICEDTLSMAGFLIRLLIVALGLALASELVPGIEVRGVGTLLGAALLLGIVNAVIRPVLIILTLPATVFTLGLFLLVINAAMLGLVAWMFDNFSIAGFWPALFGSIIVSLTGWLASYFIGPRGQVEVIITRQRRW